MLKTKTKFKIPKKWLIFALLLFIFLAATAYAAAPAGTTPAASATDIFQDILKSFAGVLTIILSFLKKVLWPIFLLIGGLLNNDLLFGAGMEERILLIWTQIRNIVNIVFAIILVGVALYNVTGFAKEEFDLKKFLPKFAIALIAVNFSYVALKVVLDVTNVFTVAVFAIPKTISADLVRATSLGVETPPNSGKFRQKCYNPDGSIAADPGCDEEVEKYAQDKKVTERDKIDNIVGSYCTNLYGPVDESRVPKVETEDVKKLFCTVNVAQQKYFLTDSGARYFTSFTSDNVALILGIQFMNIVDVDKVSDALKTDKKGKVDFAKITLNLLFSTILYVVYGTAYVAMFILLVVRLVVLWLIIVLSPLIALKLAGIKLGSGDKDYGQEFIKHAIAPLKLAIVLTIGYMLLGAFKDMGLKTTDVAYTQDFARLQTELSSLSTLQSFIVAVATVVFIWVGVKEAGKDTKAGGLIDKVTGTVAGAGRRVAGLWKLAPILPTSEGKRSIAQMIGMARKPFVDLERTHGEHSLEKSYESLSPRDIQRLRTKNFSKPEELRETAGKLAASATESPLKAEETRKLIQQWENRGTNKALIDQLQNRMSTEEWDKLLRGRGNLEPRTRKLLQEGLRAFAGPAGAAAAATQSRTPTTPGTGGAAGAGAAGAAGGAAGQQPPTTPPPPTTPTRPSIDAVAGAAFNVSHFPSGNAPDRAVWDALPANEQRPLTTLLKQRQDARDASNTTEARRINTELDNNPTFKQFQAGLTASTNLREHTDVKALANRDSFDQTQTDKLKTELEKANQALQTANVTDEAQRKKIIGAALTSAGVKLEAVKRNRTLKNYVP